MGIRTKEVTKTIVTENIVQISCDLCGEKGSDEDIGYHNESTGWLDNIFAQITWTAGYGSWSDGQRFKAVLCDRCMELLSIDSPRRDALQAYVKELMVKEIGNKGGSE